MGAMCEWRTSGGERQRQLSTGDKDARKVNLLFAQWFVKPRGSHSSTATVAYGVERLIEPSSSWFPPKFPSG